MEHWTAERYRQYIAKKHTGKRISKAEKVFEQVYILPRVATGEIARYETQVQFELWPAAGTERRIVFTPDFVIQYATGRCEVVEMKGKIIKRLQRDYHLRVRRFKELYPEYEYREEKSEEWSK